MKKSSIRSITAFVTKTSKHDEIDKLLVVKIGSLSLADAKTHHTKLSDMIDNHAHEHEGDPRFKALKTLRVCCKTRIDGLQTEAARQSAEAEQGNLAIA